MATIRDVAERAGVSAGTVSNVLNRPSYVKAETRERVLVAIQELGFRPRARAQRFRDGRRRTLGIVLANLQNPFFVDVALGAEDFARQLRVGVVICNSAYDLEREVQNLDLLVQQRVQGIIISPVDETNDRLDLLKDRGVPMVFVDRVGEDRECWSVVVDDFRGGQVAAEHLIDRGHHRMAFAGHPNTSPKTAARLEGVRRVLTRRGDRHLEVIHTDSWTVAAGREVGSAIAERSPADRPTAVICANDMVALGLLQALLTRGISVPGDIALIGYDDLEWAEISAPPLTTVSQPRTLLGRTAVEMMMELFGGSATLPRANHVVLEPEIVIRGTT